MDDWYEYSSIAATPGPSSEAETLVLLVAGRRRGHLAPGLSHRLPGELETLRRFVWLAWFPEDPEPLGEVCLVGEVGFEPSISAKKAATNVVGAIRALERRLIEPARLERSGIANRHTSFRRQKLARRGPRRRKARRDLAVAAAAALD